MNIRIVCVGELKEKYFKDGIAEYAERSSRFAEFRIMEVSDEKAPENMGEAEQEHVKEVGGEKILSKIEGKEYVIVTAIKGRERAGEELVKEIVDLSIYGHSDIIFMVGGGLGTDLAMNKRADDLLSFGELTMPHQLMRLVLTEQICRAFVINSGSPYHK